MGDIEEKRVYGDRAGKAELLVAAAIGVLEVEVSGARVGRFGIAHRCDPVDVAAGGGRVALATDEDVLVREPGNDGFEATGFGPAVAVGFDGGVPVAAAPDGRVARLAIDDEGAAGDRSDDGHEAPRGWADLGLLDAEVRAVDGRLLAAADGVYRLPGLEYAGLDDARDVAAAGPLAATGDGLYSLGNGWMDVLEGTFEVAVASRDRARAARAHAATPEAFYERRSGEDGWRTVELPVEEPVVGVAYGEVPYVVTEDGSAVAEDEDGWRAHSLGVEGVVGCAVR